MPRCARCGSEVPVYEGVFVRTPEICERYGIVEGSFVCRRCWEDMHEREPVPSSSPEPEFPPGLPPDEAVEELRRRLIETVTELELVKAEAEGLRRRVGELEGQLRKRKHRGGKRG